MTQLDWVLALPWLLPFLTIPILMYRRPRLGDCQPIADIAVSVVIPARNESANIGKLLDSLLATDHREIEFIVVDDRSTDGTAAIVAQYAGRDDRIRLVRGSELPEGWLGKPWACVQGYREARHDVLLFTDADTVHQPSLVSRAIAALRQSQADLVTVMPHQECLSFWERVVMPHVWLLLGLRFHPWLVNRSTKASEVIANGQFIMVDRKAYQEVGTHEAVKDQIAEDLALAQEFKLAGYKLLFAFATDLMTTRMYRDLAGLIEGWSKNLFVGSVRSLRGRPVLMRIVPALLVLPAVFWLIPPLAVVATLVQGGVSSAALLAGTSGAIFWALVCRGMRIPVGYGLAYPVGAAMYGYIALRSLLRGRRQVEWRGRVYDLR